jgi:hypothetical protein
LKQVVIFIFTLSLSFFASAQKINYNISATLNDKDNSIDGLLTVNYTNNSSDSIHFLWFNMYPNAFKSDRTAFSEYMLSKGRTDFYFSRPADRGYINRLDFRSGDNILKIEDHPQYIDVVKVIFEKPLAPGSSKNITSPFHVKLPYNFDGIGYRDPQYDLRYWYPAVAAYVKPLTNMDSSSNEVADYEIRFTARSDFSVNSSEQHSTYQSNDNSFKTILLTASSVKDVSLTIVKPLKRNTTTKSDEHDIFRFLKRSNAKSNSFSKPNSLSTFHSQADSIVHKKINKIFSYPFLPAAGFNEYDGFQLGVLTQNIQKQKPFTYYAAPVYTFKSKSIAGIAGASYDMHPEKYVNEIEAGFTASSFSYNDGVNGDNKKVFAKLIKIVPYIKITLPSQAPQIERTLTFKTYIVSERDLEFIRDTVNHTFYQQEGKFKTRYINELTFDYSSDRILYPYHVQLQAQQAGNWYRLNATGNYFFNYPKGGGMNARVFAAKFGYIGGVSSAEKFENLRYMPKLTAVRGGEDYTYSNYFIGRNNFDGFSSRQIMMRDGGLKLRTDLFEGLQGRSDDWMASVNLNTNIPLLPSKVPLKLFFDAGTYSEAWDDDNPNPRFLYVAGLQLSLFKDMLNIYAPVFYSKEFRDQLKSVPEEDKFLKKLSFSIDIQRIDLKKVL